MMMSWQMNGYWLLQSTQFKGGIGGPLRFGNDRLDKTTSLQACQWCQTIVLVIVYPQQNPPILSHPLKRCQTLWVHPCGEEEEVMSTPKGNGGHCWPAWLPMTPGKGGMESMCLDPHPNQKKNKNLSPCQRGVWEVAGWMGRSGGWGSGWWWVPDWGTSGDFWRGRAMHHVSCYQP